MIIIRVDLAARFLKELERLSRKYPRAIDEVDLLVNQLKQGQQSGDKIPGVGYEVYKVRLKIPSAGRGKRGGFRAIYYIHLANYIILISIYSKSQQEDISGEEIRRAIIEAIFAMNKNDQAE